MSLNNPNTQAASKFEDQAETDTSIQQPKTQTTEAAAEGKVGEDAPAKANDEQSTTALATVKTSALAAPRPGSPAALLAQSNVLELGARNALPVSWEDFTAVNANLGQFQIKGAETATPIGTELGIKLVSFQDQWVSAPKDNDAEGDDLVRYSDDGVNLNDDSGRTIKEHADMLVEKGEEPTLSHRLVLVAELQSCGEAGMHEIGNLVQIILSDSARRNFISHTKQVAYQTAEGRMREGDANFLKLTAHQAGTGKKQYTLVKTTYGTDHGPQKG